MGTRNGFPYLHAMGYDGQSPSMPDAITVVDAAGPGACGVRRRRAGGRHLRDDRTAAPPHLLPVKEQTLPSGLRVVIERDETAAVAGVVLTVDVGSVDNPPASTAWRTRWSTSSSAPPTRAELDVFAAGRLGAASFNGETGIERTTYWAVGQRRTIDELCNRARAAGRSAARATEELFAKEASLVAEELRRREGASGWEVMMPALLPPGHPHARAWADRRQTAAAVARRDPRVRRTALPPGTDDAGDLRPGPRPTWRQALGAKLPPALQGARPSAARPIRREPAAFAGPGARRPDLPIAQVESPARAVDGVARAARRGIAASDWRSWRASSTACCRDASMVTSQPTCWTSTPGRSPGRSVRARSSAASSCALEDAVRIRDETRRRWRRCPT